MVSELIWKAHFVHWSLFSFIQFPWPSEFTTEFFGMISDPLCLERRGGDTLPSCSLLTVLRVAKVELNLTVSGIT